MKRENRVLKVLIILMMALSIFNSPLTGNGSNDVVNATESSTFYTETNPAYFKTSGSAITGLSPEGIAASPTEIIIPETINGRTITSINRQAFYGNATITKLVIPSTITYIGYHAFSQCTTLTEVVFLDGDETHPGLRFDLYVFQNSFASGAEVYLPIQMSDLGNGPFRDTPNLSKLHMPETLTNNRTIRLPNSFVNNSGITYLKIPEYVSSLGPYFVFRSGLQQIDFEADASSIVIEDKAFLPSAGVATPDPAYPIIFTSKQEKEIFEQKSPDYIHNHITYEVALQFCDQEGNSLAGYPLVAKLINFPYALVKSVDGVWSNDTTLMLPAVPDGTNSTGWTYTQGGHNDVLASNAVTFDKAYLNVPIYRQYVHFGEYQHYQIDAPIGVEGVDYYEYRDLYYSIDPILWEVIEKEGNIYELLSTNLVDAQPLYQEYTSNVTWQGSSLQSWTNGEFLDDAFNDYQESLLQKQNDDYINILDSNEYDEYANNGYPLVLLENSRETRKTYYLQRQTEHIHFGGGSLYNSWLIIPGITTVGIVVSEDATKAIGVSMVDSYGVRVRIVVDATNQLVIGEGTLASPWTFMPPPTIKEPTPNIQIDYINETLNGYEAGATYIVNGKEVISVDGILPITNDLFNTTMTIIKKGDSINTLDSDTQSLSIPARPVIDPSGDNHDGKITNVATGYIYHKVDQTTWHDITTSEVFGLVGGSYEVQKEATTSSFKSIIVPVVVKPVTTSTITIEAESLEATTGDKITIHYSINGVNQQLPNGTINIKLNGVTLTTIPVTSTSGSYEFDALEAMHGEITFEFVPNDNIEYLVSSTTVNIIITDPVIPAPVPSPPGTGTGINILYIQALCCVSGLLIICIVLKRKIEYRK